METKNTIIQNYAQAILTTVMDLTSTTERLNDNKDENIGVVKILNVILESIRSHTVLIQQELDNYN